MGAWDKQEKYSLLVTARSQHTGIPYRRKALLDARRVLLGDCAAVSRFGSPCGRRQLEISWRTCRVLTHKERHASHNTLPCRNIAYCANNKTRDQTGRRQGTAGTFDVLEPQR